VTKNRSEIFFARGLDSRVGVELICEFRVFAHALLRLDGRPRMMTRDEIAPIFPLVGQTGRLMRWSFDPPSAAAG